MRLQTIKLLALAPIVTLIFIAQHGLALYAPAGPQAVLGAGQDSSPSEAIDEFDCVIQKRFHNVIGFGMARIAKEKKFVPETEEEKEAVKSLSKARLRVGMYLAGRLVFEPKPSQSAWGQYGIDRTISQPIFLGSETRRKDLPAQLDLWEQTQQALGSFAQGANLYEFTVGEWSVRARPVRASDESCLRCHSKDYRLVYPGNGLIGYEPKGDSNLKVGDPIGVLLYVYSQAR